MIKAILFDLDETLLDRDASIRAFLEGQYARFAPILNQIPMAHYGERFRFHDEHGYVAKEIVYDRLVNEFDLNIAPARLIDDFYTNSWQPPILFAGTIELLQTLRADDHKLGIITNGSERTQRPKIDQGGLAPHVDVSLISEVEGVRKPDSEIFARAIQRLGVEAHECVMIGDNPVADVGGALAFGMKAIWRRGHLPWPDKAAALPHLAIDDINELHDIDWQNL